MYIPHTYVCNAKRDFSVIDLTSLTTALISTYSPLRKLEVTATL